MEQLIDFHAPEVQAVLDTLLKDHSTGKNIIWATDPPEELQTVMYEPVTDRSQITTQQLGLTHYEVVLPRMMKQTDTQQQRLGLGNLCVAGTHNGLVDHRESLHMVHDAAS